MSNTNKLQVPLEVKSKGAQETLESEPNLTWLEALPGIVSDLNRVEKRDEAIAQIKMIAEKADHFDDLQTKIHYPGMDGHSLCGYNGHVSKEDWNRCPVSRRSHRRCSHCQKRVNKRKQIK